MPFIVFLRFSTACHSHDSGKILIHRNTSFEWFPFLKPRSNLTNMKKTKIPCLGVKFLNIFVLQKVCVELQKMQAWNMSQFYFTSAKRPSRTHHSFGRQYEFHRRKRSLIRFYLFRLCFPIIISSFTINAIKHEEDTIDINIPVSSTVYS